jgi:hypothetical protein
MLWFFHGIVYEIYWKIAKTFYKIKTKMKISIYSPLKDTNLISSGFLAKLATVKSFKPSGLLFSV